MKISTILLAVIAGAVATSSPIEEVEQETLNTPTCQQVANYCKNKGYKAYCKKGGSYYDCTGNMYGGGKSPWTKYCPSGQGVMCRGGNNPNVNINICINVNVAANS